MLHIASCCPATGLPVKTATGRRQVIGPAHRMIFARIGRLMLYGAPEGSVNLKKLQGSL